MQTYIHVLKDDMTVHDSSLASANQFAWKSANWAVGQTPGTYLPRLICYWHTHRAGEDRTSNEVTFTWLKCVERNPSDKVMLLGNSCHDLCDGYTQTASISSFCGHTHCCQLIPRIQNSHILTFIVEHDCPCCTAHSKVAPGPATSLQENTTRCCSIGGPNGNYLHT